MKGKPTTPSLKTTQTSRFKPQIFDPPTSLIHGLEFSFSPTFF